MSEVALRQGGFHGWRGKCEVGEHKSTKSSRAVWGWPGTQNSSPTLLGILERNITPSKFQPQSPLSRTGVCSRRRSVLTTSLVVVVLLHPKYGFIGGLAMWTMSSKIVSYPRVTQDYQYLGLPFRSWDQRWLVPTWSLETIGHGLRIRHESSFRKLCWDKRREKERTLKRNGYILQRCYTASSPRDVSSMLWFWRGRADGDSPPTILVGGIYRYRVHVKPPRAYDWYFSRGRDELDITIRSHDKKAHMQILNPLTLMTKKPWTRAWQVTNRWRRRIRRRR